MPVIELKTFDTRLDPETTPKIIEALTDALCGVIGESARGETWVIVHGVSPSNWGFGGKLRT